MQIVMNYYTNKSILFENGDNKCTTYKRVRVPVLFHVNMLLSRLSDEHTFNPRRIVNKQL